MTNRRIGVEPMSGYCWEGFESLKIDDPTTVADQLPRPTKYNLRGGDMCGKIVKELDDSAPVNGVGYKIFSIKPNACKLTGWNTRDARYKKNGRWVNWEKNLCDYLDNPDGFCVFRTRKDVKEFLKYYIRIKEDEDWQAFSEDTWTVRKVRYRDAKGFARHDGVTFIVASAFTPTRGWRVSNG